MQRQPVPAYLRAIRCKFLLYTFPTRQKSPRSRPCEAVPQESGFSARPTTMNHTGVPESMACEHDEASFRRPHKLKQLWKSTKFEITAATHVPAETSCRIPVRNEVLSRHTWVQTSCRAHAMPDDVTLSSRSQVHRHVEQKLSGHAFLNRWTCSRFVNSSSARCASASLLRSARGREW